MLIQNAIKSINSISDRWVRVEQLLRIRSGLQICFSVHKGNRGKKVEVWDFTCRGVHEAKITDLNGGGLAFYPSAHPAARQYSARRAELRWPRTCNEMQVLAALFRAHVRATDDWIPFDRYLLIDTPWNGTSFYPYFAPVSGANFVCRGPDFLLRAYAETLQAMGERVQLTLRASTKSKSIRPKVLHFGESYVVANAFAANRLI
jgi:hypothetical protein